VCNRGNGLSPSTAAKWDEIGGFQVTRLEFGGVAGELVAAHENERLEEWCRASGAETREGRVHWYLGVGEDGEGTPIFGMRE
jgi:hypothetical protein